ncbi:MAG: hypothetical protein JW724_07070 [Candidatus Altiarchaeota archaeon]|nr:hypothetical protein [Candidatus Altiarchaeota archaeon]
MAYVRAKKIKGNTYYYLVKTVREKGRVRQVVLDYLGTEKPGGERNVKERKQSQKSF